eukprot:GHUV01022179.1.p1 GENE.GHUV01022179.1~~GHUV01022179.1.p1  ORF type:complete len:181 (+),score=30.24 GHUV01022179.1:30-572(+)
MVANSGSNQLQLCCCLLATAAVQTGQLLSCIVSSPLHSWPWLTAAIPNFKPTSDLYLLRQLTSQIWYMHLLLCTGTVCDYSELSPEQFWVAMARRNYLWGYKPDGTPIDLQKLAKQLPSTVEGLVDDPYRSLAALVRKAGGYQKSSKPFSEVGRVHWLEAYTQQIRDPSTVRGTHVYRPL